MAATYTVPGLLAGALGDVLGAPVAGMAQGALAAPQIEAQYRNMGLAERSMGLHEQQAAQQAARQAAMDPLKQRFMEAEIKRMQRPELLQTPWGTFRHDIDSGRTTEIALPRPKFEQVPDGAGGSWVKKTTPDGVTTYERPTLTPERFAAGQAELAKIGPQDIGGMLRWASQYPELSGGVDKYMGYYQKMRDADARSREAQARIDAYNQRTNMMGRRAGAQGAQPTITSTTQPGGPVTNPAEFGLATKTFQDLVGYQKTPPGMLWGKGEYVPGAMNDRYIGFSENGPNVWDKVVGRAVPKEDAIANEMNRRGYDVVPRFNNLTKTWEMLGVSHAPKTKEVRKTIGPSREAPSAIFGGGMPLGQEEED
jgi:hypothetical protein